MMDAGNSMQFYLAAAVGQDQLIPKLSSLLGIGIESLDHPDGDAKAFLQETTYDEGQFPIGVCVSWRPDLRPLTDHLDVARSLAALFRTRVATDLPAGHRSARSPYSWCLVEPSGSSFEVPEDLDFADSDGLFLDEDAKKPIESGTFCRSGLYP